jgi:uncharacterized protein (DUF2141 family)
MSAVPTFLKSAAWLPCLAIAGVITGPAHAAELVVRVSGVAEAAGQVGCSLFASAGASGFPMDNAAARVVWLPADPKGVTCRFADVPAGRYAVSIGHDLNGNRRVDTNFVGMPTEAWGVSNDVRPTLRAPRFDEAAFQIAADAAERVLEIRVAK